MTQPVFATVEEVYHNPGNRVLTVVTGLACNVADETIYANVAENARTCPKGWVKLIEPHQGVALLCGSGPSLADSIEIIREAKREGARLFAMNGAANYLFSKHGIMPDYQVIMDAKPETVTLIGPAFDHLFASQVDPACFKLEPNARLWHSTHGTWVPDFPDHDEDYCIIGGSVTVGNTAPALVYAMGYRNIRCFGYDSSHRDTEGHAFAQPMNDGDQCMVTRFDGRDYVSSYAMKLQADTFMQRLRPLEEAGCMITVEGEGLLPALWRAAKEPMSEREKYERMWAHAQYRAFSPGQNVAARFAAIETERGPILDIGCGTGRGSLELKALGFAPLLVDFAANARDPEAVDLPFVLCDISREALPSSAFGFCTDVMEHLPPDEVDATLRNILKACDKTFFAISTVPDSMGVLISKELHLTVRPFDWWAEKLAELGLILWSDSTPETALFYVRSLS